MSSSTKIQTIDGYIEEYAHKHDEKAIEAIQTAMCGEFIKYADDRDTAIYQKGKENQNGNF